MLAVTDGRYTVKLCFIARHLLIHLPIHSFRVHGLILLYRGKYIFHKQPQGVLLRNVACYIIIELRELKLRVDRH